MSAAALTYDSLLSDVQTYCERDDDPFVAQIPRFLLLAENRIASEVRGLGYLRFVGGTMVAGNPIMVKPARWRESSSFNYTDAAGARHYLFERGYDYCRAFWPVQSATAAPKYYANYDFEHFLLAGTPDSNYAFELAYFERPLPLSSTNQESWTTQYAPQLLLYATLLEAQPFLKLPERIAEFKSFYDTAKAAIAGEGSRRTNDQANVRTDA